MTTTRETSASQAWSDWLIADHRVPLWLRVTVAAWRGATTCGPQSGTREEILYLDPGALAALVHTTDRKALGPAIARAVAVGMLAPGSGTTRLIVPRVPRAAASKAEVRP